MEINNLLNLPAHPLLVHVPVILIPLAFVGSIVVAVRPGWRRKFAVPVAILAAVGALGVWLAAQSGENLEERVRESDQVEDHAQAGERAELPAAAFAVLAIGLAAVDTVDRRRRTADGAPDSGGSVRPGDPGQPGAVAVAERTTTGASALSRAVVPLAVVTVLAGAVSSYTVYEAGHSGATSVWEDLAKHPEPGSDAAKESKGGGEQREGDESGDGDGD